VALTSPCRSIKSTYFILLLSSFANSACVKIRIDLTGSLGRGPRVFIIELEKRQPTQDSSQPAVSFDIHPVFLRKHARPTHAINSDPLARILDFDGQIRPARETVLVDPAIRAVDADLNTILTDVKPL
jgi:hypothetical protein